ncbi:DUF1708 family conserved fungal protein, cell division site [Schizosaccharomyces osmophilus]|uniref:DUF1708 family conserved fungal protein, cell division site n=1 Tax=Schizosaccharomyces osmophilus TaxID=2545709 RepID=A0AAF0AWN8_9SCHI|nr:DUF1708 family conserved fungal protein, cell division site [Schizosaccharomyces osmophilus]WBW73907.1 DUF1708 family conserved fungal protein, cell division site [Schizosaccharomyces osmophilus]
MDYWNQESIDLAQVELVFKELASRLEHLEMDSSNILFRIAVGSQPDKYWESIAFVREFYKNLERKQKVEPDEIRNQVRLLSEASLISCLRWILHRIPGGVITWSTYKLFQEAELRANYPSSGFNIFMKHATKNSHHLNVLKHFLKLMMSLSAKMATSTQVHRGSSLESVAQIASIWAFEWPQMSLQDTLEYWNKCSNACFHLLLCYIRSMDKQDQSGFSCLPYTLQTQVQRCKYPPRTINYLNEKASLVNFSLSSYFSKDPLEIIQLVFQMPVPRNISSSLPRRFEDVQTKCLSTLQQVSKRTSYHSVFSIQESAWSSFINNGFNHPIAPTKTQETVCSILSGEISTSDFPHVAPLDQVSSLDKNIANQCSFESISPVSSSKNLWWLWVESRCPEIPESKRTAFMNCTMMLDKMDKLLIFEQSVPTPNLLTQQNDYQAKTTLLNKIRSSFKRVIKPRKFHKKTSMLTNSPRRSCQSVLYESNRAILLHLADQMNQLSSADAYKNEVKPLNLISEHKEDWDPEATGYVNTLLNWANKRQSIYDEPIKLTYPNNINPHQSNDEKASSSASINKFMSSSLTATSDNSSITGGSTFSSIESQPKSQPKNIPAGLNRNNKPKNLPTMLAKKMSISNHRGASSAAKTEKNIRPPLKDWDSTETMSPMFTKATNSARSSPFSLDRTMSTRA